MKEDTCTKEHEREHLHHKAWKRTHALETLRTRLAPKNTKEDTCTIEQERNTCTKEHKGGLLHQRAQGTTKEHEEGKLQPKNIKIINRTWRRTPAPKSMKEDTCTREHEKQNCAAVVQVGKNVFFANFHQPNWKLGTKTKEDTCTKENEEQHLHQRTWWWALPLLNFKSNTCTKDLWKTTS